MKNIIIFVLGLGAGLVLGGKLGYEYVVNSLTDNMDSMVSQIMDEGIISGANSIGQSLQTQGSQLIESQKEKMKEEMKAQLTLSINQQIDAFFK